MIIDSHRPLLIEPLTPHHLPDVMQVDRLCFGGLWTEAGYRREIDSPNSQLLILKSPDGTPRSSPTDASPANPIIGLGCTWFILEEAHITLLAVQPPFRRQGMATLLLVKLLKTAVKRGSEWATLEVRQTNHAAQALYNQMEFVTIGQRKRYYKDTGEDALILWNKKLQNPAFLNRLTQIEHQTLQRLGRSGWRVALRH